jgi:hypothetical protein
MNDKNTRPLGDPATVRVSHSLLWGKGAGSYVRIELGGLQPPEHGVGGFVDKDSRRLDGAQWN